MLGEEFPDLLLPYLDRLEKISSRRLFRVPPVFTVIPGTFAVWVAALASWIPFDHVYSKQRERDREIQC